MNEPHNGNSIIPYQITPTHSLMLTAIENVGATPFFTFGCAVVKKFHRCLSLPFFSLFSFRSHFSNKFYCQVRSCFHVVMVPNLTTNKWMNLISLMSLSTERLYQKLHSITTRTQIVHNQKWHGFTAFGASVLGDNIKSFRASVSECTGLMTILSTSNNY